MCITCIIRDLNLRSSYLKLWIRAPNFLFNNMYVALFDLCMDQLGTLKSTLMHLVVMHILPKCLLKFYNFRANDPGCRITSIHMDMFGILGTIILSTLCPQWSSWISRESHILWSNRIENRQHQLVECGRTHHIHFKFIKLQSYDSLRCSSSTWMFDLQSKFSHPRVGYVFHIPISPPQHTSMGMRDPRGIIIRHSLHILDHPCVGNLYTDCMLITLRMILGIRGRFIPHIECQELRVNVTSWHPPHKYLCTEESELLGRNILFALLQIICQLHLLTKGVIRFQYHCTRKSGGTYFKTTQLPNKRGRSMVTGDIASCKLMWKQWNKSTSSWLTPYEYFVSKTYGCSISKRPAYVYTNSGAGSQEHSNSVIMGIDMEC
jgi:hypothetical protein